MNSTSQNQQDNTDTGAIVVSGSSGLIGTALINKLAKKYQVIGLDKAGYPFPPITAECVCMDITSDKSIKRAMDRIRYAYGGRIASVVHLAAYYDFSGKPSPLYERITVHGTEKLLKALQSFEVEQFIFSSSLLVYKPTEPGIKITEDAPLQPKWDYPKSKVETENVLHTQRGKIPITELRIAGIYTDECHSIPIAHQIQRIYEKQLTSHLYPGDVTHGNPYLHLNDLVNAILKAIEKRKSLPSEIIINLGEPDTMSFMELQQTIAELIYGKKWKTIIIPKWFAKAGAWLQDLFGDPFIKPWMIDMADDHMEIDISRAKNLLGWVPEHKNSLILFEYYCQKLIIECHKNIEENIFIKADPNAIDRIINNLIENAIKFSDTNGNIKIMLKIVDDQIHFSVQDTGIGIPPELQKKIFEPYYQINHKKTGLQGMGLGLPIVKKVVESLGGQIQIDSNPDISPGTTISIMFSKYNLTENVVPAANPTEAQSLNYNIEHFDITDTPYLPCRRSILLIEDQKAMLMFLFKRLSNKYNVFCSLNGAEALKKLHNLPVIPDLILSDIMMDKMDGFAFAKAISGQDAYNHIPIIFLSAKSTPTDKLKGLRLGAIDLIPKPF